MAPADDDFEFVLSAADRLLGEIREEIISRRRKNERGDVLASHVLGALDAIATRVDAERQLYPSRNSDLAKKAGARQLRFYTQLIWATHAAVQWLAPDADQPLDLGALYFADETALELLEPGVEVMPIASGEYMYSTSMWPFDWLLHGQLGEEPKEGQRPVPVIVTYPAHENKTMLLHGLFAHELAHTRVGELDLVAKVMEPLETAGHYDTWLQEAVQSEGRFPSLVEERAPRLASLWLEELLCDALAFALLGPAYVLPFAEMGLSVGWGEPDDEHPSMALRTQLQVKFAEKNGWAPMLKNELPTTWAWLEFAGKGPSKVPSTSESFAEQICRNSVDKVIELAQATTGKSQFTPDTWQKNAKYLAELLEYDILPVEVENGGTATHPEILTACWLSGLQNHGDKPASISKVLAETDYQRFIAKALEMSTMMRIWKSGEQDDTA